LAAFNLWWYWHEKIKQGGCTKQPEPFVQIFDISARLRRKACAFSVTHPPLRVQEKGLKTMTPANRPHEEAGFSLIEASTVMLFIFIVSGFAILNLNGVMPGMRANAAATQTLAQLRSGREQAIAQRRNIELRFTGTNQIQLVRYNVPSGTTVLSTTTLEGRNEFRLFGGVSDTPDAFGNGSAVSFGGPGPWLFLSNGILVDSGANPINGTVFLGQADHPETARAVTILGATGRVRDYKWTGTAWIH
jgi:Tfp pilus assembly protein FimT